GPERDDAGRSAAAPPRARRSWSRRSSLTAAVRPRSPEARGAGGTRASGLDAAARAAASSSRACRRACSVETCCFRCSASRAASLAGIAFVGCDLLAAAPARAQARRREVMVGGRRVKTVDVHAHCAVPEAMALMGMKLSTPGSTLPPLLHMATQASERIRAMDEQGIDVEALSINPYWYKADRDVASQPNKLQNE